jgi:modulator of FtsH protease
MESQSLQGWGEFGVAAAGATAALAGLLIVAMSVNVREIVASRALVHGARSTIASLVLAIVTSLLLLVPGQPVGLLGAETLALTVPAAILQVSSIRTQRRMSGEGITGGVLAFIVVLALLQYLPFLAAGVLLALGLAAGAWALAAGIAIVVIASMINAWVLLLEVQR